jgi:hypothetical protein
MGGYHPQITHSLDTEDTRRRPESVARSLRQPHGLNPGIDIFRSDQLP